MEWLRENPWRTASLALGVALLLSLGTLVWSSGGDDEAPESADTTTTSIETGSSTTTTTLDSGTTTTLGPGTTSTTTESPNPGQPPSVLGVRIDNSPQARPQWGLNQAGLLIEYPVEGGITRFTAVFESGNAGLAGPVRSLRPVDADLVSPFTTVLATSGGQDFVVRETAATGIELVVAQLSSLFPSVGNPDPYDTFVDLELLRDFASNVEDGPQGLPIGALPAGDQANTVTLPFDGVSFVFESGEYTRLEGSNAFSVLDLNGQNLAPLTHETLVVLFAAERPAGYADVNGIPVVTYDVIGSGRLLVFNGGEVVEGTWSRAAQEDPYVFEDINGVEFGLPGGSTYMAIVPRDLEVEIS